MSKQIGMKQKIKNEDLEIIRRLFIPEKSEVYVHDLKSRFQKGKYIALSHINPEQRGLIISGKEADAYDFSDYCRVLQFGASSSGDCYSKKFRYIRVNGNIRWIFPEGQIQSIFKFYHASTLRAKLIRSCLKIVAALKLDRFLFNQLTVHSASDQSLAFELKEMPFEEYAIFTGTPGLGRTALIAFQTHKKCTHFLKVGLKTRAQCNVANEGNVLHKLSYTSLVSFQVPASRSTKYRGVIAVANLQHKNKKTTHLFTSVHARAFIEMSNMSITLRRFDNTLFGDTIIDNCSELKKQNGKGTLLDQLLLKNLNDVTHDDHYTAGFSHGDFTPWNMFIGSEKLYLYDWELSMNDAPLLFDMFHYHFQTGIFLKRWKFHQINTQIKITIQNHREIDKMIREYNLDIKRQLQLYLLYTISQQTKRDAGAGSVLAHQQKVWEEALQYTLPEMEIARPEFIEEFNTFLQGVQHAYLKFNAPSLKELPIGSDLDLAIDKSTLVETVAFCQGHHTVKRMKQVKKSFMTTLELFFYDGAFLSIDLIHDFKRKWVRYMNIDHLLRSAYRNDQGILIPDLRFHIEYTLLFYVLNHSDVPEKYISLFDSFPQEQKSRTQAYFKHKYEIQSECITSLLNPSEGERKAIFNKVSKPCTNALITNLKLQWNYFQDTIKELRGKRGIILTISGVDGVGKTTVIENVQRELKKKYRRDIVLMRHRPKLLPLLSTLRYGSVKKAEKNSQKERPGELTHKNGIGSYLRFSYYYLDYVLGQFYVQVRYVWAGKIVIYDRYYFDFINHPERSNLSINPHIARWLYRSILKPSLNIFLYASPDQICERKQELRPQEIGLLTQKYVNLFGDFSRKYKRSDYIVHRNEVLSTTITRILEDFQRIA